MIIKVELHVRKRKTTENKKLRRGHKEGNDRNQHVIDKQKYKGGGPGDNGKERPT